MFLSLSAEQNAITAQVRDFALKHVLPHEASAPASTEHGRKLLKMLGDANLLGLNIPEEFGGVGLSHTDAMLAVEEMGRHSIDAAWMMAAASLGQAYYIYTFGTAAQRQKYLPAICRGDYSVAIGITEPEAGTASTALKTRAMAQGDTITLNGRKHYVSNVPLSDLFIIYGRMSATPGAKGIGAVLVERGTPGFVVERLSENMGGHYQADLVFDDCVIPKDNLLVAEGDFAALTHCYNLERCGGTGTVLGIAIGAYDKALEYVQSRQQFGKSLVDFQAVQLKLADMAAQIYAARLMLYDALSTAQGPYPTPIKASLTKVFGNEAAKYVSDTALQLFGGAGYLKESGIEQRYRVVRGYSIAGGPLDIHRTMVAGWLTERRFSQWA